MACTCMSLCRPATMSGMPDMIPGAWWKPMTAFSAGLMVDAPPCTRDALEAARPVHASVHKGRGRQLARRAESARERERQSRRTQAQHVLDFPPNLAQHAVRDQRSVSLQIANHNPGAQRSVARARAATSKCAQRAGENVLKADAIQERELVLLVVGERAFFHRHVFPLLRAQRLHHENRERLSSATLVSARAGPRGSP